MRLTLRDWAFADVHLTSLSTRQLRQSEAQAPIAQRRRWRYGLVEFPLFEIGKH